MLLGLFLAPGGALAAPRPGESCPDTTPAPGASAVVCGEGDPNVGGGTTGGVDLGGLLPIVAGIVVAGGAVLLGALLLLRRRTLAPAAPADPKEWWTCRNCGKANVIGSPRCYACGQWQ
jgi:hypothetical protein